MLGALVIGEPLLIQYISRQFGGEDF